MNYIRFSYVASLLLCLAVFAACTQSTPNQNDITPNQDDITPTASSYTIYNDALAANWQNWNWNQQSVDLASTGHYSGTKGIRAVLNAYGGFSVRYGGTALATSNYSGLSFKVFQQGRGSKLEVLVYQDDDTVFGKTVITLQAKTWQSVTLSWSQLGNPSKIKRIAFKDGSGSGLEFYLDDIVLTAGTTPTSTVWKLSPGMNLGHGFEPPSEGAWGYDIKQSHFKTMADAGFKSVRIPIRWSSHTIDNNDTIDPAFFARVDQVISWAHAQKLLVVLDMHHWGFEGADYDSIFVNPPAQRARFMKLWQQIAAHYKNYSNDNVYFELFNEPHNDGKCTRPANQCFGDDNVYWASFLQEGLQVIRSSGGNNATRKVIIGNAEYNTVTRIKSDTFANALPASDRNIIVTFHMYEPFCFTHLNCDTWTGSGSDKTLVTEALDAAVAFGKRHNRPIYIGEWGAQTDRDYASRARYYRFVQAELNKRNLDWAFWDFASDSFGIFNPATDRFYPELINAVMNR